MEYFSNNPKNYRQYYARCYVPEKADTYHFIITLAGKYYRFLGNKQWEPYEYVFTPADAGGDQCEKETPGDEAERT